MYGSHAIPVGVTQCPAPSHFESPTFWFVAGLQLPAMQTVVTPYFLQAPLPSQTPSRPQLEVASGPHAPCAGLAPFDSSVHLPRFVVWLHDLQDSVHGASQHTPSAQFPLTQSALLVQTCPLIRIGVRSAGGPRSFGARPPRSTAPNGSSAMSSPGLTGSCPFFQQVSSIAQ
jgi:hypothetical protein